MIFYFNLLIKEVRVKILRPSFHVYQRVICLLWFSHQEKKLMDDQKSK